MHGLFFLQKSRFIIDICRKQRIIIGISQKPKEDGAMPRPKKCRRICALPRCDSFGPLAGDAAEEIEMSLDEFEAVRLIDLLGCSQEECAAQMGVARTTAQAVYNSARQKLAAVLVRGGRLCIRGGDYQLCPHGCECHGHRCCGQHTCRQAARPTDVPEGA